MRHLEKTNCDNIPERIALQENEIITLCSAVPDMHEAIKLAYAAGVHAVEDEHSFEEKFIHEAKQTVLQSRDLLMGVCGAAFNPSFGGFLGSICAMRDGTFEERIRVAADWAERYYQGQNYL